MPNCVIASASPSDQDARAADAPIDRCADRAYPQPRHAAGLQRAHHIARVITIAVSATSSSRSRCTFGSHINTAAALVVSRGKRKPRSTPTRPSRGLRFRDCESRARARRRHRPRVSVHGDRLGIGGPPGASPARPEGEAMRAPRVGMACACPNDGRRDHLRSRPCRGTRPRRCSAGGM